MKALDINENSRRFGGLQRLYGESALSTLAQAHVMVAGIGGVGSWCAEALARCGVGQLTLVDLDHIAVSNINRQLHALDSTLGMAKITAMAKRIHDINPRCQLRCIDDFVTPDNAAALVGGDIQWVIDCTDQTSAKVAMILACREQGKGLLVCGGAGGKTNPLALRAGDLSLARHDALLARLRNRLRRHHGYPKGHSQAGKRPKRAPLMGISALWLDQPVLLPATGTSEAHSRCPIDSASNTPPSVGVQGLSCAGYGSDVTITATMGLVAANHVVSALLAARTQATSYPLSRHVGTEEVF